MGELSIEEKAKCYDEAIEKFVVILNLDIVKESGTIFADDVRKILPELAELEDENIRKGIIRCVKDNMPDNDFRKKYIAWLESQAEYAKFRDSIQIGDKVTRNQDGVLVNLSQFERMANPKKELKKTETEIEIPFGAKDSELQEVTYYIPKGFHAEIDDNKVVIKKGEKPIAWSEEDEEILNQIIENIVYLAGPYACYYKVESWLKSLKERVQPKQEWSEEDKMRIKRLCDFVWDNRKGDTDEISQQEKDVYWLESLRPQNT